MTLVLFGNAVFAGGQPTKKVMMSDPEPPIKLRPIEANGRAARSGPNSGSSWKSLANRQGSAIQNV